MPLYEPASGLTLPLAQDLTFATDSTYDVGEDATRPANVFSDVLDAPTLNMRLDSGGGPTIAIRKFSGTGVLGGLSWQKDNSGWEETFFVSAIDSQGLRFGFNGLLAGTRGFYVDSSGSLVPFDDSAMPGPDIGREPVDERVNHIYTHSLYLSGQGGTLVLTDSENPSISQNPQHDWGADGMVANFALSQDTVLTGIASPADGKVLLLVNRQPSFTLTISHEDAGSTAANRIRCPGETNYKLAPRGSVLLIYSGGAARWYVIGQLVSAPIGLAEQNPGSFTVPTDGNAYLPERLTMNSRNRGIIEGAGTMAIENPRVPFQGAYRTGSFELPHEQYLMQQKRLELTRGVRATLRGNARTSVEDPSQPGTPTGTISAFAGAAAPAGWLPCDGAAVSRTSYAALFAIVTTTYGAGDGSTTFNVPNLKGKVIVGVDPADASFDVVGETGGAKTHTLTNNHVGTAVANPASESAHQHGVGGLSTGTPTGVGTTNAGGAVGYANSVHTHVLNGANTAAGSGHTHAQGAVTQPTAHGVVNTVPPYMALHYIIKT